MAGNFEITTHGVATVVGSIKADAERVKGESKRIATRAAEEAAATMRFLVPKGTSDMFMGYDTLESRISSTPAVYQPGGAGGGGTWVAKAGVRESPRFPDPKRDPAYWVYEGTGLFGPHRTEILPRSGNFMVFKSKGRWVFTDVVKGQEPQRLWVSAAQDRANAVVANELAKLAEDFRNRQRELP